MPNQFNATQLEISTSATSGDVISSNITSGDLGGLLAARTQVINPALNQLGQIATALVADRQLAAGARPGPERQARRAHIFSGRATRHRLLEKHGCGHRQRQRQRERLGRADSE